MFSLFICNFKSQRIVPADDSRQCEGTTLLFRVRDNQELCSNLIPFHPLYEGRQQPDKHIEHWVQIPIVFANKPTP